MRSFTLFILVATILTLFSSSSSAALGLVQAYEITTDASDRVLILDSSSNTWKLVCTDSYGAATSVRNTNIGLCKLMGYTFVDTETGTTLTATSTATTSPFAFGYKSMSSSTSPTGVFSASTTGLSFVGSSSCTSGRAVTLKCKGIRDGAVSNRGVVASYPTTASATSVTVLRLNSRYQMLQVRDAHTSTWKAVCGGSSSSSTPTGISDTTAGTLCALFGMQPDSAATFRPDSSNSLSSYGMRLQSCSSISTTTRASVSSHCTAVSDSSGVCATTSSSYNIGLRCKTYYDSSYLSGDHLLKRGSVALPAKTNMLMSWKYTTSTNSTASWEGVCSYYSYAPSSTTAKKMCGFLNAGTYGRLSLDTSLYGAETAKLKLSSCGSYDETFYECTLSSSSTSCLDHRKLQLECSTADQGWDSLPDAVQITIIIYASVFGAIFFFAIVVPLLVYCIGGAAFCCCAAAKAGGGGGGGGMTVGSGVVTTTTGNAISPEQAQQLEAHRQGSPTQHPPIIVPHDTAPASQGTLVDTKGGRVHQSFAPDAQHFASFQGGVQMTTFDQAHGQPVVGQPNNNNTYFMQQQQQPSQVFGQQNSQMMFVQQPQPSQVFGQQNSQVFVQQQPPIQQVVVVSSPPGRSI